MSEYQQVFGLDVSVHDAPAVDEVQGVADVLQHARRAALTKLDAGHDGIKQVPLGRQLHDQVDVRAGVVAPQQLHHPGMLQTGQQGDLKWCVPNAVNMMNKVARAEL